MSHERKNHYYLNFFTIQQLIQMNRLLNTLQEKGLSGDPSSLRTLLTLFRLVNRGLTEHQLAALLEDSLPLGPQGTKFMVKIKTMGFSAILVRFAVLKNGLKDEGRIIEFLLGFQPTAFAEDMAILFSMIEGVSPADCEAALSISGDTESAMKKLTTQATSFSSFLHMLGILLRQAADLRQQTPIKRDPERFSIISGVPNLVRTSPVEQFSQILSLYFPNSLPVSWFFFFFFFL